MTIGEKIRFYRKKKNLSQRELGIRSGLSEISIRKYETGDRNPKIETLQKIADALDVFITDLNPQLNDTLSILTEKKTQLYNEWKETMISFSDEEFFGDKWIETNNTYRQKMDSIENQLEELNALIPAHHYETTGEKIKRIRLEKGINLIDFSESTQIPIPLLIKLENNFRSLTFDTLHKISKALDIAQIDLDPELAFGWGFRCDTPQDILYKKLLDNYERLNAESQKKVVEYTELLLKIPDCREPDNSEEELENKISTQQNPPTT